MNVEQTDLVIETADNWNLSGTVFRGPDPKFAIMISAGTGFPKQFYRAAAEHMAARGAVVLTYDYRGIGASRTESLENSEIDYPDWGRLDMAAALDALERSAPGLSLNHLAHSVGGHFLGLMPNQDKLVRNAFVSVGTGYWFHHHKNYWPLEFHFWWLFGTYSLLRYNYIKTLGGWRGEALPPRLFKTWRRWATRSDYFRSEFDTLLNPNHYGEVRSTIRAWVFSDDPIATERSANELFKAYPNAPKELWFRSPADYDQKRIGHDGAFRKGREKLWDEIWEWLADEKERHFV